LNFSFVFAGSAGVNPAMILVSLFLILAWRNAGWYGLDRFVLPRLGTPGTGASCSAPAGTRDPR
jgi:thiosulfate dehydrogenase [quinone] large subunit